MNLLVVLNWCYGIARPYSPVFCPDVHQVANQIKRVATFFDRCLIINDSHTRKDEPEFKYLPPHNKSILDCNHLDLGLYRLCNNVEIIKKHTMNPFICDGHAWKLLIGLRPTNIMVAGYTASIDVLSTCLGLIDDGRNVYVHRDCVGDITPDRKTKSIEHLTFIGVPILTGEINDSSFSFFERQADAVESVP